MGRAARATVLAGFGIGRMAREIERVYREALLAAREAAQ